ncbi:MAG: hypothetical protein JW929_09970 [Anaerolineales bacterium]|nr:hypothetical protein [Anaerolineales bacterium]
MLELVRRALELNHVQYRERFEDFELVDTNAIIKTSISGMFGTSKLEIDPPEKQPLLTEVIQTMKSIAEEHQELFYPASMVFHSLWGIILLVITIGYTFIIIKYYSLP